MHIHLGALDFLIFCAYFIVFSFIWQTIAVRYAHTPIGRAMAYIHD